MTWSLASFLLLGLALLAGFAWYERSKPSAKVLALVATLSALAALGRIAFAPLPNVKPTTDIVLLAGAVLGGPAGFAVGAVAALTSNLVFGEGPWTPWQMAAWGGCGLLGAAVLRPRNGRLPGRWTLAAVGALAGLAFGLVLDFSDWLLYLPHTPGAFLARSATSLPWNLAHALGNAVFALAFGPALGRALLRFRARFEVTWRPAPAAVASVLGAIVVLAGLGASAPAARAASSSSYLRAAQHADGGWGSTRSASSSPLYSGWAALALASVGENPADQREGGASALDYLRKTVGTQRRTGDLERTLLVLGAAGASPRSFGGRDLLAALLRHRRRDGSFDGQVNLTAFGVLALRAVGAPAGPNSARWLLRQQDRDGGWNFFRRGAGSDVDDTGGVLEALAASGHGSGRAVDRAVAYLARTQGRDGGFPASFGPSNAQSTAFAVQGLVAAGRDPGRLRRRGGRSPLEYLRSLTGSDGSIRYSRASGQDPVWVTAQAVLALRRMPFPLRAVGGQAATSGSAHAAAARGTQRNAKAKAKAARRSRRAHRSSRDRAARTAARASSVPLLARSAGAFCALLLAPTR